MQGSDHGCESWKLQSHDLGQPVLVLLLHSGFSPLNGDAVY